MGESGAGKTTLAGKLAHWLKSEGHRPMLVAADLQRPNAVNQLEIVGERAGAFVYASKVPERWCPGMFDYFGGSHNLWHIAVLGGILFHYTAMQEFFSQAFRRAEGGCPAY